MKKIVLVFIFFTQILYAYNLPYVDFETSMQLEKHEHFVDPEKTSKNTGIPYDQLMNFFKELYEKNSFLKIVPSKQTRVPKIIHQIWIGKKVPEEFKEFQKSWKKFHPDWEYRLWTQRDIDGFGFYNIDIIRESRNPGEISDLMRYEILYRYGGLYVDFDFECLRPHDELNHMYDFYVGIQPLDSDDLQLGIGLIGSVPGHPILESAIKNMRASWDTPGTFGFPAIRTGPIFFTRIFFETAGKDSYIDVALPVHYFYPMDCKDYTLRYDQWFDSGSFGVHHWASSWTLQEFRRPKFRSIKNYKGAK